MNGNISSVNRRSLNLLLQVGSGSVEKINRTGSRSGSTKINGYDLIRIRILIPAFMYIYFWTKKIPTRKKNLHFYRTVVDSPSPLSERSNKNASFFLRAP